MVPVYIPSMGRAGRKGKTAESLTADSLVNYIVPPEEEETYRAGLMRSGLGWCGVIPCPHRGIAATRRFIGELAAVAGHSKFVMMDDDLQFYVRKSPEAFNLRYTSPHEVTGALDWLERALDQHAHVSLSAREGNNRVGAGPPETLVAENTRTLRVLAYRTEEFLACEHGRVDVMEDFDVNLQLLRRGLSNAVSFHWAQGQKMTNEAGGCSTYRTHAVHEASARRLAELHPEFVRLRQKENKSGGAFGHRTEVTISWKKAYDEGLRTRAVGSTG